MNLKNYLDDFLFYIYKKMYNLYFYLFIQNIIVLL